MNTVQLTPERTALAAVAVLALGTLPLAASSAWFTPLLLVPVMWGTWILRARVVGAPVGVEVCNGLRTRRFRWQDVEGFDLPPRGQVRMVVAGGRRLRLTAMARKDLPKLLAVGENASLPAGGDAL